MLVAEDSDGSERLRAVRREITLAAITAAGASAHLSSALQFSLALADTTSRAEIYAALADDTLALHSLLNRTLEDAFDAVRAPSWADFDASGTRATWSPRSAQVRALVGRLEGATSALGLTPASP